MNKHVKVTVCGHHKSGDDDAKICVVSQGQCLINESKNDKRYFVKYEENTEEGNSYTCVLKINNETVEMIKKGVCDTHMIFEKGQRNNTYINTAFGRIFMGVKTLSINKKESENLLEIGIKYELFMEEERISECQVDIVIESEKII